MRDIQAAPNEFDQYFSALYPQELHPLVGEAREKSQAFGKLGISMSHTESRIMASFIKSNQCKKFVEIGTLTGATAIWIAESLQEKGELWTFEKDLAHAEAARQVFETYHQKSHRRIHLKVGDAVELLGSIESDGPFDGIFIDGNKAAYGSYLNWAERNIRKGGLIIGDNVFLGGSVFNRSSEQLGSQSGPKFSAKQIQVMREFNQRLADSQKYQSALIPTPEGMMVAIKL